MAFIPLKITVLKWKITKCCYAKNHALLAGYKKVPSGGS